MTFVNEDTKFVWSTAYINDLPDSSFLYIEQGGEKDESGKTTPRTLRHLPYKDVDGKVDVDHLRNAIARTSQVKDKDGNLLSDDLVKKLQDKARTILEKQKGEFKVDVENKDISKFSEESAIEKIKAIIAKIDSAETIDEVKALVPELEALIPEEDMEKKEVGSEDDPKEEKPKVAEPLMDEVKEPEDIEKAKSGAEIELDLLKKQLDEAQKKVDEELAKKKPKDEEEDEEDDEEKVKNKQSSLSDILELNDKLLIQLKSASKNIEILEAKNEEFLNKISSLEAELTSFKEIENKKIEEKRIEKFNTVFDKYVKFFKVGESDVEKIRTEMSKFSEGVLANIEDHINSKIKTETESEADIVTMSSSELENIKVTENKNQVNWKDLSPKEKTKFLFEQAKKLNI